MSQTITIDPVTRLEGHGKITLKTNEQGEVTEAYFSVTQVRGFEKFCEGRPYYEMPGLMARICGICPVSHLIASAKACEAIMSIDIPPTAAKLRRALNLAQTVQSHSLSFFYLASPDLLLGMDADPEERNIFGVANANPKLGLAGIGLRRFGQHMIELLGRKRIHPGWVVPGGVTEPLDPAKRDEILRLIPEAYANVRLALDWYRQVVDRFRDEADHFANFPGAFMGMVGEDGGLEFTDGTLRMIDAGGNILLDKLRAAQFEDYFGEAVEPFSYMKFPYLKSLGYPAGSYRVGPLARLNIASHAGTPLADVELKEFKKLANGPVLGSFYYHHARLIDILHGIEVIERIFDNPNILDKHVRATAGVNRLEGSGVAEAPRGTLMHHYKVDENGQMLWANLVIATGQNNNAMNRGILQAAQRYVKGDKLVNGMLNRVEATIRTFDPCLSCSTHAYGQMPLHIELLGPDDAKLDEIRRG
jgi:NAD-reducing hydrogenase large subunit